MAHPVKSPNTNSWMDKSHWIFGDTLSVTDASAEPSIDALLLSQEAELQEPKQESLVVNGKTKSLPMFQGKRE